MLRDPKDKNHIIADSGNVFRRKGTDEILGEEVFLGLSFYDASGNVLDNPHTDTVKDFEEIKNPYNE